jgi:hypothetical protein
VEASTSMPDTGVTSTWRDCHCAGTRPGMRRGHLRCRSFGREATANTRSSTTTQDHDQVRYEDGEPSPPQLDQGLRQVRNHRGRVEPSPSCAEVGMSLLHLGLVYDRPPQLLHARQFLAALCPHGAPFTAPRDELGE